MRFDVAIDQFISDWRMQGHMRSDSTERSYRGALYKHCEDVNNRDPRLVGRQDVKRTLARWSHPATRANRRAALVSFYRWMVEEGLRDNNPAEQTRRPKRHPAHKTRLTRNELRLLMGAVRTTRERRAIYLSAYLGLRRAELLSLRGRNFSRPGWVTVIGKGKKPRSVPVPPPLQPVVDEIRSSVGAEEYVFPAQRTRDPGVNREKVDKKLQPASPKAFWEMFVRLGERAGIATHVHPHLLRHAFAEQAVRQTDVRNVQRLLGHSDLATTQIYLGTPSSDELREAVRGLDLGAPVSQIWLSPPMHPANPVEAPAGIEPA